MLSESVCSPKGASPSTAASAEHGAPQVGEGDRPDGVTHDDHVDDGTVVDAGDGQSGSKRSTWGAPTSMGPDLLVATADVAVGLFVAIPVVVVAGGVAVGLRLRGRGPKEPRAGR